MITKSLIVFLLTPKAIDPLIVSLVQAGYQVSPGGNDNKTVFQRPDKILVIGVLHITVADDVSLGKLRDDLTPIIGKQLHYGFIVGEPGSATGHSNISFASLPKKTVSERRPAHLKLFPPGPLADLVSSVEKDEKGEEEI